MIQKEYKQNLSKNAQSQMALKIVQRHFSRPNGQQNLFLGVHLALCLYCALCLYSAYIITGPNLMGLIRHNHLKRKMT